MAPTPHKPSASRAPRTGPHRQLIATQTDLTARLLASAMGLPRICEFKKCRRRKRCFGPDVVCLRHHRGLARKRMRAAIAMIAKPGNEPR